LGLAQFDGHHLWWLVESFEYPDSAKYTEPETGLLYYGYRYRNLVCWLSRDPIEENGGNNLHVFVANSSINGWDADGRKWQLATVFSGMRGNYNGGAKCGDKNASLEDLAFLVTGNRNDAKDSKLKWGYLGHPAEVGVGALLAKLEDRLRTRVVELTKVWTDQNWGFTRNLFNAGPKDEGWINNLFDPKQKGKMQFQGTDCRYAISLIMAKAVIDVLLRPGEWEQLRYQSWNFVQDGGYMLNQLANTPDQMKNGDWGYIDAPDASGNAGQNIVKVGNDQYWGFGVQPPVMSLQLWYDHLHIQSGQAGRGYNNGATVFVNVGRISAEVFKLRTQ
jgi:RHS repeat-associated protein